MTLMRTRATLVKWFARVLSWPYPASLREEYGREIHATLQLRLRAAWARRGLAPIRLVLLETTDSVVSGVKARLSRRRYDTAPKRAFPERPARSPKERISRTMDSTLQDIRYAARMLSKNPGFTAIAVAVLALGIGANTAIFTLTNALLLRPIVARDAHELVAVYNRDETRPDSYRGFSFPNYEDIRELNTTFASVLAHDITTVGVSDGDVTRRILAELVTHDYFATFGVSPSRGRFFTLSEEAPGSRAPVAVVSYEYWRDHGADPDLVGKTIRVNEQALTIVGVAPRHFTGRSALISPSLYLPLGLHGSMMSDMFSDTGEDDLADRANHTMFVVARLQPDLTIEEANGRLATLAKGLAERHPEINGDHTIVVGPLSRLNIGTDPSDDAGLGIATVLLLGMTGIVLLIACINLANMLLARGAARRREFAVRAAIGGGRARIIRQLLTEGLLLSILGGLVGLLIAYWANGLLAASVRDLLVANSLAMDVVLRAAPDLRVLAATAGFCVAGTMLFAFGPAWRHSRQEVMDSLKGEPGAARGGRARGIRRNLLAVCQLALSLVLLTAAGLFIRGALVAAEVDPGFSWQNGLVVEIDPSLAGHDEPRSRELYRRLMERLRSVPGIEAAAVAATVPFGTVSNGARVRRAEDLPQVSADGTEEIETFGVAANVIGRDYFEALGVSLVRGRGFTQAETESEGGAAVVIIDEQLAERLWPEQDPVGRQVGFGRTRADGGRGDSEVVGVAPTLRDDLFPAEPRPYVYMPFGQNFQAAMNIHLRISPMDVSARSAMLQTVRSEMRAVDDQLPIIRLLTLEGHLRESPSLWLVNVGARIFTSFGALALFLAVVGVYGVKAYAVAQRTREIGIRKSLGATSGDTVRLFLREGVATTAVGLAAGLVLAALVARLLANMLYEVSALDPLTFLAAPLILAVASLLATYIPARRAAAVDPLIALRSQ